MAYRNRTPSARHTLKNSLPDKRRARRRQLRDDALRYELEHREHSPLQEPTHPPRVQTRRGSYAPFWKFLRRAVAVLALVGMIELVVAALTARPCEVQNLDVTGCELTDQEQVLAIAQPLVGQNWIRAGTKNIETQIEEIPTVQRAHVSRVLDWPPRLHITVEERVAFAKVGASDNWWVVDHSGVAFRPAEEKDKELYAVTSPKLAPLLGKALPEDKWRPVVEIADSLQNSQQGWALRRIYFDKDGSAALRLTGGFHDETLVRLGTDHWSKKLVRASQALSYLEHDGRRAAVLNLVSYEMPQWTPKQPVTASTPGGITQPADTHSET